MLMSHATDLVPRATIEQIIGHRNRAIENYDTAHRFTRLANEAAKAACPSAHSFAPTGRIELSGHLHADVARYTRELDAGIWRHLMKSSELESLMDRTAKQEFARQLEKGEVPEITFENVLATFTAKLGEAPEIFRRGLVETFRRLDRNYRSNDAFKLQDRTIFNVAVTYWGRGFHWAHYSRVEDELRDVERVFYVLDGKPQPDRSGGIIGTVYTAMSQGEQEARDEYFRCKWFKKGSMHVYFLRPDLLEKCNRIIAEHYGETLASA